MVTLDLDLVHGHFVSVSIWILKVHALLDLCVGNGSNWKDGLLVMILAPEWVYLNIQWWEFPVTWLTAYIYIFVTSLQKHVHWANFEYQKLKHKDMEGMETRGLESGHLVFPDTCFWESVLYGLCGCFFPLNSFWRVEPVLKFCIDLASRKIPWSFGRKAPGQ